MNKTNFEKVKEFHKVFGTKNIPENPTIPETQQIILNGKCILEEFLELIESLGLVLITEFSEYENKPIKKLMTKGVFTGVNHSLNLNEIAKECADLIYVAYGLATACGIPMDEVFNKVHESNMSKLDDNGKVLRREDGKILKGPNYKKPEFNF